MTAYEKKLRKALRGAANHLEIMAGFAHGLSRADRRPVIREVADGAQRHADEVRAFLNARPARRAGR